MAFRPASTDNFMLEIEIEIERDRDRERERESNRDGEIPIRRDSHEPLAALAAIMPCRA